MAWHILRSISVLQHHIDISRNLLILSCRTPLKRNTFECFKAAVVITMRFICILEEPWLQIAVEGFAVCREGREALSCSQSLTNISFIAFLDPGIFAPFGEEAQPKSLWSLGSSSHHSCSAIFFCTTLQCLEQQMLLQVDLYIKKFLAHMINKNLFPDAEKLVTP